MTFMYLGLCSDLNLMGRLAEREEHQCESQQIVRDVRSDVKGFLGESMNLLPNLSEQTKISGQLSHHPAWRCLRARMVAGSVGSTGAERFSSHFSALRARASSPPLPGPLPSAPSRSDICSSPCPPPALPWPPSHPSQNAP